jgi:hypothetical protein
VVVAALLSSVRLASLLMEMERSGEDKQATGERGERRGDGSGLCPACG